MNQRKEQQKSRKVKLFLALNVVVLFFLVLAFGREYVGNLQIQREIEQLEAQRMELEDEQLNTLALIGQLSSEYYLETEARTKHGLAKDGETLIVVQDGATRSGDVLGESDERLDFVPNYQRWFFYFFDKDRLVVEEVL